MKGKQITVIETNSDGAKLLVRNDFSKGEAAVEITIDPNRRLQKIIGFGGSFTQASAHNFSLLNEKNKALLLEKYFGPSGANYSMCRKAINSTDFSTHNFSYSLKPNDYTLSEFSIEEDTKAVIPFIKAAKEYSKKGFKIISSPWTAPPWMKSNNSWVGGHLRADCYGVWADYFCKYLLAYQAEGIDIWAITLENEPLGNDNNWESMHFTPDQLHLFAKNYLRPKLQEANIKIKVLGYDQNRDEPIYDWAKLMYQTDNDAQVYDGMAIHWYASTYKVFSKALNFVHELAPEKMIIQTEACIDAEVPRWKDDKWYWAENAKDWGFQWSKPEHRHLHPKYTPVFRYAGDIIGCMNNWVNAWIDWNLLLDTGGGPNWAKNWCIAPVIVDTQLNELYFTPLYYVMCHFSKHIRPDAHRILWSSNNEEIEVTAFQNRDSSVVILLLNRTKEKKTIALKCDEEYWNFDISREAIQTVIIK